eukprot:gene19145-22890_t
MTLAENLDTASWCAGPFCFQQMQAGIHKPSAALDAVETDPYEGKSTVFAIKAVKDFDNVLSLRTTLVEFFHPDPAVCPQCKEALIELEMAAKELRHSGVTVVKVNCAERPEGGLTAVDMGKPKWDVEELAEEVPTEGRAEAAEARTGKGKEAAAQASSRPDARSRSALRRAVEDQMLSGIDKVDGVVSKATDMSRVIEFVNNSPRSISLFWVDFRGTEKEYIKLKPQEKQRLSTYVSHVWVIHTTHTRLIVLFSHHWLEATAHYYPPVAAA